MVLAGHNHHASSHDASDLVTRAGGVLVVQAGTATSTRVREQEQSFNTIDIGDGAVDGCRPCLERRSIRPKRCPRRYAWHDGSWLRSPAERSAGTELVAGAALA